MSEGFLVIAAFADEAAAWRSVDALLSQGGVVVFAASVIACDEFRRTIVPADQGPLSLRLAHLLNALVARTEPAGRPAVVLAPRGQVIDDLDTLVGVLEVLPRGHAAIVAEVFEAAPSRLERTITAFGGRVVHRRPPGQWAKVEGMFDDDGLNAKEVRTAALNRCIASATGADKAALVKRSEELRLQQQAAEQRQN